MNNELAKDFDLPSLIRFTLPTIIMLVFVATYTIVDGIFISRFVSIDALSAINIIYPINNIVMGIGIMMSTGGSAIIGKRMGEGKDDEARQSFTLIVFFTLAVSIILSFFAFIFITPLSRILGANDVLLPYCEDYGRVLMAFFAMCVLQVLFQTLFVTAGKPKLGLFLSIASGLGNIVFDYLFIVVMDMGVAGAAWGTVASYIIGGVPPLIYFLKPRTTLYFVKPKWEGFVILRSILNGSSEMVNSLAMAVTTILFNIAMMELLGENGVAAITIVLYAQFLFSSAYMGFSNGSAPIFSYIYGSGNIPRLKKMFKLCVGVIVASSVIMLGLSFILAKPAIVIFAPVGTPAYEIALEGYHIFAWNFLFAGINIFASAFFTALSNGKLSAIISFSRTFLFVTLCILILTRLFGVNGLWLAIPVAESVTVILVVYMFFANVRHYHYL